MYNAMIHPLRKMAFKGVVFYQVRVPCMRVLMHAYIHVCIGMCVWLCVHVCVYTRI